MWYNSTVLIRNDAFTMNRLLRIKHTFLTHNHIMEINELPTRESFGVNNIVKHITKCRKYEDTGKKNIPQQVRKVTSIAVWTGFPIKYK